MHRHRNNQGIIMAFTELHNLILQQFMFNIRELTINQTFTDGTVFDTSGFGSQELFIHTTDDIGDGNYTMVIKHGNDSNPVTHVAVPDEDLVGPNITVTGQNDFGKQGYIGKKRFLSIDIVAFGITSGNRVGSFLIADTVRHLPLT